MATKNSSDSDSQEFHLTDTEEDFLNFVSIKKSTGPHTPMQSRPPSRSRNICTDIILAACKPFNAKGHKRARWFQIEDVKNNTNRFELVYVYKYVKYRNKEKEYVEVRRMNHLKTTKPLKVKKAKNECPTQQISFNRKDIEWLIHCGMDSFLKYHDQINNKYDNSGAIYESPSISYTQSNKNYHESSLKAQLADKDAEIKQLKRKNKLLKIEMNPGNKNINKSQSKLSNSFRSTSNKDAATDLISTRYPSGNNDAEPYKKRMLSKDIEFNALKTEFEQYQQSKKQQKEKDDATIKKLKQQLYDTQKRNQFICDNQYKKQPIQPQKGKPSIPQIIVSNKKEYEDLIKKMQQQHADMLVEKQKENEELQMEVTDSLSVKMNDEDQKRQIKMLERQLNNALNDSKRFENDLHSKINIINDNNELIAKLGNDEKQREKIENNIQESTKQIETENKHVRDENDDDGDARKQHLIDFYIAQNAKIREERDDLQDKLDEYQQEMENNELQNEFISVSNELKDMKKERDDLRNEVLNNDNDEKHKALKYEYDHISAVSASLGTDNNKLRAELESTRNVLGVRDESIKNHYVEIENKTREIEELKRMVVTNKHEISKSKKILEASDRTITQYIAKYDVLQNKYDVIKSAHNTLKEDNDKQTTSAKQMTVKLNQLTDELKILYEENNNYKQRITNCTIQILSLQNENAAHKETHKALRNKIEKHEDREKYSAQGMIKINNDRKRLKSQNNDYEDAINNITAVLEDANETKAKLNDALQKQAADIMNLKKQQEETQLNSTKLLLEKEKVERARDRILDNWKQLTKKYELENEQNKGILSGLNEQISRLETEKKGLTNKYFIALREKTRLSDEILNNKIKMNDDFKQNECNERYNEQIKGLNLQINELRQENKRSALVINPIAGQMIKKEDEEEEEEEDANGSMHTDKEQVNIQKMTKETLQKKYKILKSKNITLQKQIMRLLSPSDDKSDFPVIEDIRADFDTLRKQYFTDIFDEITNEISEQYEHIEAQWEEDDADDDDSDDEGEDLFNSVVDREARRILFDLLHITYHFIRVFKHEKFDDIIDWIAVKFELKSSKSKRKMSKSMAMVINPYFQNYYEVFNRNRYMRDDGKNNRNGELFSSDMNKIIDAIFVFIQKKYAFYTFWGQKSITKQFEIFISKACELCWIMVLNMPQLYFYPRLFSINDNDMAKKEYDGNISYIYNQTLTETEPDGDAEAVKKKKKKKRKKKQNKEEDDDKDEEEEMDKVVKEHDICNPFESKIFDDKYHDCLNEAGNSDDDDDDDYNGNGNANNNNNNIMNHNGMEIAYCGWPSLVRIPQLESEQHTQITKTFAYFHSQPKQFMAKMLPKENYV